MLHLPDTAFVETAWIVSILKTRNSTTSPSCYRPNSLLSDAAKLLERLIYHRVVWFLEANNLLPFEMSSFLKQLFARDRILYLTSDHNQNRSRRKHTLSVILDINKAYETVHAGIAMKCFRKLGLKVKLIDFLKACLNGRSFQVRLSGTLSATRPLPIGVPHASVLCFLMLSSTSDSTNTTCRSPVSVTIFADDVFACTGPFK